MRDKGRLCRTLAFGITAVVAAAALGLDVFAQPAAIADALPADPMIAAIHNVHPLGKIEVWLERMREAIGGEDVDPWAELDEKTGMSFRDDVLGAFGPELAFALDLPDLDPEKGAAGLLGPDGAERVFAGWLLVARVEDKERATRALGALFGLAGAELVSEGDRMSARISNPSRPDEGLTIHARIHGDRIVISGSRERVDQSIQGFEPGKRLVDGADFARVSSHAVAGFDTLTYFNLPKIRDWLRNSGLMAMSGAEDLEGYLTDEWMGMGLIQTSRRADGGVEVSHFGPEATSEALWAVWTGAVLLPATLGSTLENLAAASGKSETLRAMADLRTIGTAMEAFAVDNNRYPATSGWETTEALRPWLEPSYIHDLPDTDPWGTPYHVWSDGRTYRLVSSGSDRTTDRDWSGEVESGATSDTAADLVFVDGQFARWGE